MTRTLLAAMLLFSSAASVLAEETPIRPVNFAGQDSQLNQCPKIMKDPAAHEPAVVRVCEKIYALLK